MLNKAISKGHVKGVLDHLIPGGISHIQYADDTVLMIAGSDQSVKNLKLILYYFEWLTGLKINFHKSEVLVFGFPQSEKERLANMLNYAFEELPMKYLGIPISDHHLSMVQWGPLLLLLRKCIKGWIPGKGSI